MSVPLVTPTTVTMAGSFISDNPPPLFAQADLHPVYKHIKGTADVRKVQLLHSANVEGFLFINNNKLVTIYLAQIAFDHTSDPQEQHPLVIGALGSLCADAVPISLSLQDVLADSLVLEAYDPSSSAHPFLTGKDLSDEFFNTVMYPTQALTKLDTPDLTYRLVRLPTCIPKLRGQPILEGSIFDDSIISAIENYSTDAGQWLELHVAAAKANPSSILPASIEAIDASYLPPITFDTPLVVSPQLSLNILIDGNNIPNSPRSIVQTAIKATIAANTAIYKANNPYLITADTPTHPPQVSPSPPSIPMLTNPSTPPSANDSFQCQGITLNKKFERPINTFKTMLAYIDEDTMLVHTPPLRKEFLHAFTQTSAVENARYATKAFKEHDIERAELTRDYLQRLVTGLHWNHTTTSLFLNAIFHTSPLDEHKDVLKASISFLTFLAPPPESSSSELQEYLQTSHIETMQAMVGESNEKKERISLKTFQGGMQNSPNDVLVGIANLESRISFIVDYSEASSTSTPMLVTWLIQLAHVFSSPEFKKFYSKYSSTHQWIAHTMVTQVHILFAMMAKIASNFKVLQAIKFNQQLKADLFQLPIRTFSSIISDIQTVVSGAGAGVYSSPPLSYKPPRSDTQKQIVKRKFETISSNSTSLPSSDAKRFSSPSDKGWITATGRYLWPKDITGKQICNRFAQIGSSCPHGANCPFSHRVFPKDFDQNDRDIICKFVTNHPNLSFASWIKPGSSSGGSSHHQSSPPPSYSSHRKPSSSNHLPSSSHRSSGTSLSPRPAVSFAPKSS